VIFLPRIVPSWDPRVPLDFSTVPPTKAPQPDTVGIFFCVDVSGSMTSKIGGIPKIDISTRAMNVVFDQIAAFTQAHPEKKVKVGLCAFEARPKIVLPLSPFGLNAARSAAASLRTGDNTGIGRAIALALTELMKSGDETKAILVMTDGENNRGRDPAEIVRAIKQNNNTRKMPTVDVEVSLIAFDVKSNIFDGVKEAGATVMESRDEASLKQIMTSMVEEVLLEAP
jgi:Mg-chelatase subunit ChlD